MVIDFDDKEDAVFIFKTYMKVRQKLRLRKEKSMSGQGARLQIIEGSPQDTPEAREAWEAHWRRDQEMQITHLADELEEKMQLAELKGEGQLAAHFQTYYRIVHQILHCLIGKRYTRNMDGFGNEDMWTKFDTLEKELRAELNTRNSGSMSVADLDAWLERI